MSKYTSNAEWPDTVRLGCTPNVSTDTHDSKEFAEAVCRRLEREGFGGERKIFPIRVWVEEIPSEEPEPRPSRALTNLAIMGAAVGVNVSALLEHAIGKVKVPKAMGPGAGTNRMRRRAQGKAW